MTVVEASIDDDNPYRDLTPEQVTAWLSRYFHGVIGLRFTEISADRVRSELPVTPALQQGAGIVHGGVYCSVVESTASVAATAWLAGRGRVIGVNNNTDFLRAVSSGTLFAEATPVHRGRSQQLWSVEVTDDRERAVARGQVRLHNEYGQVTLPERPTPSNG
ncbi:PaaI family thioesterase [Nocardia paucivorans]|uniref:PaaI family thioesterase n=1 Tax=Nocardia paucivorans TaxID=114259 RepID=UPI0002D5DE36|nr:PaaI family thioesterase [Nocardia paucivorans]